MPTYEYVCKACDLEFEREQRISDPPVKTCPSCKAKQVKRLISRTSFHLKGGGWYSDLYAKPKGGKTDGETKTEPASGGESKAGGGGESKAESKPEKKADKKPAKSGSGGSGSSGSSGGSGSGGSGSKAAA
ncbi:MAG TPA: zinc ribbon domain-containing protein [Myxococcota bacterium]|nr:zinc ribbon domain-containing protein [Myxococcota bacterium]